MPPWPIVDQYFYTERWAKIPDPRLSIPYSIGWWFTVAVGLWSLFVQRGFLQLDAELRGVIRPRLNNRPSSAHHKPFPQGKFSPALRTGSEQPAYCHDSSIDENGINKFDIRGWDRAAVGCKQWDPMSVSKKVGQAGMFVATRVMEQHQVSVCQTRTSNPEAATSAWGHGPGPAQPLCRCACRGNLLVWQLV
jgi:hypothetical protein